MTRWTISLMVLSALRRYLNKQRKARSGGAAEVVKFRTASEQNSDTEADPISNSN